MENILIKIQDIYYFSWSTLAICNQSVFLPNVYLQVKKLHRVTLLFSSMYFKTFYLHILHKNCKVFATIGF